MPDMLVKLYDLPEASGLIKRHQASGIEIRRALAPEKHVVADWVRGAFNAAWASECAVAFSNQPLLLTVLHAMAAQGYGYAIIGAVTKPDFYIKTVGATVIEGSEPGIYRGMLRSQRTE